MYSLKRKVFLFERDYQDDDMKIIKYCMRITKNMIKRKYINNNPKKFDRYEFEVEPNHCDLYFWGIKK